MDSKMNRAELENAILQHIREWGRDGATVLYTGSLLCADGHWNEDITLGEVVEEYVKKYDS